MHEYTLTKKDFDEIMQAVKDLERSGLEILPPEVALGVQSGYLLGYADCWAKINRMVQDRMTD